MHISRIVPDSQTRVWTHHGDPLPGLHLTPWPIDDHDMLDRFGKRFVRITTTAERFDELLRPLEHPVAVIERTCDPKTVRRHFRAAQPKAVPWPDFEDAAPDEDFRRAASPRMLRKWRRL